MLDDQIGSSDHARKKFKIIGPAHFFTLIFHLISNLAPEMWPDSLSPAQRPFLQNSIQIKKSQDGLVQWFGFLQFYVIYMVLCQIQLKLFIVTNLRPIYGPRGLWWLFLVPGFCHIFCLSTLSYAVSVLGFEPFVNPNLILVLLKFVLEMKTVDFSY